MCIVPYLRYRDYVISAFNRDLLYERFLALRPRLIVEPDKVDKQIDVIGKTFVGPTLACARCHGHDFDTSRPRNIIRQSPFLRNPTKTAGVSAPGWRWTRPAATERVSQASQTTAKGGPVNSFMSVER